MPLTILVVEDEPSNMQIISLGLTALGHRVIGAVEPVEGHRLARERGPDVILMDLMFKGACMDGVDAIRLLKADPLTAPIPVVAHTAAVLDFVEAGVCAAGAAGLVHKPFRRQQLVAAIEAAVSGCRGATWHAVSLPRAGAHVHPSPMAPTRVT